MPEGFAVIEPSLPLHVAAVITKFVIKLEQVKEIDSVAVHPLELTTVTPYVPQNKFNKSSSVEELVQAYTNGEVPIIERSIFPFC